MKNFFDIQSEYKDFVKKTGSVKTISEYAQAKDTALGVQERQAAYSEPGPMTYINAVIDKGFEVPGEIVRPLGRWAGEGIESFTGREGIGKKVEDLSTEMPRTIAEFTPWFGAAKVPSMLSTGAKAVTGLSAFARGAEETDSLVGGAISAAMLPLMPASGKAAENLVLNRMAKAGLKRGASKELIEKEAFDLLRTGQGVIKREAAVQTGMFAAGMVGDAAMATTGRGSLRDAAALVTDLDYYILNAVGQVPFLGLDAMRLNAEIQAGRKTHKVEADLRAEVFNNLVLPDYGSSDAQMDKLAKQVVALESINSPEAVAAREAWEAVAPKQHIIPGEETVLSPRVWQTMDAFRSNVPEEVIALSRGFNEIIRGLQKTDKLRTAEVMRLSEDLFPDNVVDAAGVSRFMDEQLDLGSDANAASARFTQMLKNKIARAVLESNEGKTSLLPIKDQLTIEQLKEKYPSVNVDMLGDVDAFLQKQFEEMGLDPVVATQFRKIGRKLILAVPDSTKLKFSDDSTLIKSGTAIGSYDPASGEVAVKPGGYDIVKNPTMRAFGMLRTLSHELFHSLDPRVTTENQGRGADANTDKMLGDLFVRLLIMSDNEKASFLTELNRLAIPDKLKPQPNSVEEASVRSLELNLSGGNAEFTPRVAEIMLSFTFGEYLGGKNVEALSMIPDNVSEFANGFFRNGFDIFKAMEKHSQKTYDSLIKAKGTKAHLEASLAKNNISKLTKIFKELAQYHKNIIKSRSDLLDIANFLSPQSVPELKISPAVAKAVANIDLASQKAVPSNNLTGLANAPAESNILLDALAGKADSGKPLEVLSNKLTGPMAKTANEKLAQLRRNFGIYTDAELALQPGFKFGAVEGTLGNPSQLAVKLSKMGLDAAADVIWHVQNINPEVSRFQTAMMRPFMTFNKGGVLKNMLHMDVNKVKPKDRVTKSALDLIVTHPDAWQAFSDVALLSNMLGRKTKRGLSPTDPAFKEAVERGDVRSYEKLSDSDKDQLWHVYNLVLKQNQVSAGLILYTELKKAGIMIGRAIAFENHGVSHKAAEKIGQDISQSIGKLLPQLQKDPTGVIEQMGKELTDKYSGMKFEAAASLLFGSVGEDGTRSKGLIQAYMQTAQTLNSQSEYYFSERRFGNFILTYDKPLKGNVIKHTEGFGSEKLLHERIKELSAEGATNVKTYDKKKQKIKDLPIGQDRFLEGLKPMEDVMYAAALATLGQAEADQVKAMYSPLKYSIDETRKSQLADFMKPRKLRPGRDNLDMFEVAVNYYNSLAYKMANDYAKAYTKFMLDDPSMRQHPDLVNKLTSWSENLIRPVSEEYQRIKNGIFTYFLGANISSMLIETTQAGLTTMPMIIEQLGSVTESMSLLKNSFRELGLAYTSSRSEAGRLSFKGDPKLTKAFNLAIDEQILEFGSMEDALSPTDAQEFNAAQFRDGKKGLSVAELAVKPLHWFSVFGRNMYSVVSGGNAKASFIAGFKIAQKKGMSDVDSYDYAKRFVRETTFSAGVYNRPIGFHKLGRAQGAAGVMFSLNNFTFATIHMMTRLVKDALLKSDLTPAQRTAAAKAATQMLGTQFALAGAFGMPFSGAAIAIMEELFGTTVRDDIREALYEIGGEDELGQHFADVATRGLPTMLGLDLQSRYGLGSVLGFSEYSGFDTSGFLGASGGVVSNMYQAIGHLAKGDFAKAMVKAAPQALTPVLEMARTKGQFVDQKGELMLEANHGEQLAYLIGLRPKALADVRLQQKVNRQANDTANRERRKALREFADEIQNMQPHKVREAVDNLIETNPLFQFDNKKQLIARLVEVMIEKQVPLDPNESGSYASLPERERLQKTLPVIRRRRASEEQILMLKNQLLNQLSEEPVGINENQMTKARWLDQYLDANPRTSRQRASIEFELMVDQMR